MYERTSRHTKAFYDLASNVKRLREEKGMTQMQLAGLSGLSSATISKLENYSDIGTRDSIDKLAAGLDVTVEELIDISAYLSLPKSMPRGRIKGTMTEEDMQRSTIISTSLHRMRTLSVDDCLKILKYIKEIQEANTHA